MQIRPCRPWTSSVAPHLQVWATQMLQPRRRETATRTVSSLSFMPQDETGSTKSQSPLWEADTARNVAIFTGSEMEDSTTARDAQVCPRRTACEEADQTLTVNRRLFAKWWGDPLSDILRSKRNTAICYVDYTSLGRNAQPLMHWLLANACLFSYSCCRLSLFPVYFVTVGLSWS